MRNEIDPKLRSLTSAMRKSQAEPERRLWWALRHSLPLKDTHFRRQVVIDRAIVDFACIATRTIVEVDGGKHRCDRSLAYDAERTQALEARGWRVLRFSNAQIFRELDDVLETILAAVEGRLQILRKRGAPHPLPPPRKRGGERKAP